jgi:chaperone modulatory protein CbpM
MSRVDKQPFEGEIIDPQAEISIVQLCRRCAVEAELIQRLVDEGILEPVRRTGTTLYFTSGSTRRIRLVMRLQSDLGVNIAGAALAIDLLDQIERLNSRVRLNDQRERSGF